MYFAAFPLANDKPINMTRPTLLYFAGAELEEVPERRGEHDEGGANGVLRREAVDINVQK